MVTFARAVDKPPPSVAGAAKVPYFVGVDPLRGLIRLLAHRIR